MLLHLHLEEQITLLKPWFCLYNFSQILSETLTLKIKVMHYDLGHFFVRRARAYVRARARDIEAKFFIAFLDELDNSKHFEPYFFFWKIFGLSGLRRPHQPQ